VRITKQAMRTRFAMRFGDQRDVEADAEGSGTERTRSDLVRSAFNSPFWPFVLVSTSVGQEGLDFHQYCHAIVHWNLPSNPVDMEQQEGRVHRFKGHAVRKNVAREFGDIRLDTEASRNDADPWEVMFSQARLARGEAQSDLVPYWVFR